MKRSIKRLPKQTQEELEYLKGLVLHYVKEANMVILYGSYARGNYVLWDERVEFGVHTSYQSDYDLLVVVSNLNNQITEQKLRNKVMKAYNNHFKKRRHAVPSFIVENIKSLNDKLEKRQYFFTDLVRDGIMLFNDKKFRLAKAGNLDYREINEIAVYEYSHHYPDAVSLLKSVQCFFLENNDYRNAAFLLHQVAEKFYCAILLVCTNYRPKNHKLELFQAMAKSISPELSFVFPRDTEQARESYELLCRAYIEARYNKDYIITHDQLVYLVSRLEFFREITQRLCQNRFSYYKNKINESRREYPDSEEGTSKAAED